jgi:epsilon-lactone hydrolase
MTSIQSRLFYGMLRLTKNQSPLRTNLTLHQQRLRLQEMAQKYVKYFPSNVEGRAIRIGKLDAEWLCPANANNDGAILYLHGGAFSMGSLLEGRNLAALIALACPSRVLSLDYRLAPEHPFPDALNDSVTAYRWLLEAGISAKQIALVGASAGGNLVLSTGLALRDAGESLPNAIVALSPITDLTLSARLFTSSVKEDPLMLPEWVQPHIAYYLGQVDSCSPLVSPVFADLHGLPPLLIQVGEHEILVDDVARFVDRAKRASVKVTLEIERGMWHVYQKFAMLPESRRAIDRIGKFVRQNFGQTGEHIKVLQE